jgi:hypothetical protein
VDVFGGHLLDDYTHGRHEGGPAAPRMYQVQLTPIGSFSEKVNGIGIARDLVTFGSPIRSHT